jgi:Domain of unknown function (DUF4389)
VPRLARTPARIGSRPVGDRSLRLVLTDDLRRGRGSVFFRWWFVVPFFLWLSLWSIVAFFAALLNWLLTLLLGHSPGPLHRFLSRYVRFATHVYAYTNLATEQLPKFDGRPGYQLDLEIDPPARQRRLTVLFRLPLALPAIVLIVMLAGGGFSVFTTTWSGGLSNSGLLGTAALLGWFASIAWTRMPRGLRDAIVYVIFYGAQLWAYLLLLTDRYPCADPGLAIPRPPVRDDPISMRVGEEPRRSRLTVFFRLPLTFPHLVWLLLWGCIAWLMAIINWFAVLFDGRTPDAIHDFIAAYQRYQCHVLAYLYLIANPFPGFVGEPDSYPVELQIAAPEKQNRLTVLFRLVLVIPAALIASAYNGLLLTVAVLGWFASLVTGRMPVGLARAGALALRYCMQTSAYWLILTDSYPYSGPCRQEPADTSVATEPAFG